jgi:hypothetical protein
VGQSPAEYWQLDIANLRTDKWLLFCSVKLEPDTQGNQ